MRPRSRRSSARLPSSAGVGPERSTEPFRVPFRATPLRRTPGRPSNVSRRTKRACPQFAPKKPIRGTDPSAVVGRGKKGLSPICSKKPIWGQALSVPREELGPVPGVLKDRPAIPPWGTDQFEGASVGGLSTSDSHAGLVNLPPSANIGQGDRLHYPPKAGAPARRPRTSRNGIALTLEIIKKILKEPLPAGRLQSRGKRHDRG